MCATKHLSSFAFLLLSACVGQVQPVCAATPEGQGLSATVAEFLESWLVDRDVEAALKHLAPPAARCTYSVEDHDPLDEEEFLAECEIPEVCREFLWFLPDLIGEDETRRQTANEKLYQLYLQMMIDVLVKEFSWNPQTLAEAVFPLGGGILSGDGLNWNFRFGHPAMVRILRSAARVQGLRLPLTIDAPFAPVWVAECRSIAAFQLAGGLFGRHGSE